MASLSYFESTIDDDESAMRGGGGGGGGVAISLTYRLALPLRVTRRRGIGNDG